MTSLLRTKCFYVLCLYMCSTTYSIAETNDRVTTTISCRDCEYIPKVPDAGTTLDSNGTTVQVMHNGLYIIHHAYHGQWMSTIIKALKGHHEPQEEKVFYEALKTIPDAATMIELGSSWSYYSMWFNKEIPHARNYMIEPHQKKLALGEKHFSLNNMHGLFFNAFIGRNSDANTIFTDWDTTQYNLPRICIDDFVKEHAIEFIHLLHSDIQGAEYDMLLGCQETILKGKIGYIFISTHGNNHAKCLHFLQNNGFHIVAQHSIAESYSADGLIVARHKNFAGLDFVNVSKNNKKEKL